MSKQESLGRIVWWKASETRPGRGAWDAALVAGGLPAMPESSPEATAGRTMSRATARIKPDWLAVKTGTAAFNPAKPIKDDPLLTVRAYAVYDGHGSEEARDAQHVGFVLFLANGSIDFRDTSRADWGTAKQAFAAIHGEELTYTSRSEVTAYIVNQIVSASGIAMADDGKPYFVPASQKATVLALGKALPAIGWRLSNPLAPKESATVASILADATDTLLKQIGRVVEATQGALQEMGSGGEDAPDRTRRLKTLGSEAGSIFKLAEEYADLLGAALPGVQEKCKEVEQAIAVLGLADPTIAAGAYSEAGE